MRREKGSVLVVALWVLVFFGMMTATLGARIQSQTGVIKRLSGGQALRTSAFSGAAFVVQKIREDEEKKQAGASAPKKDETVDPFKWDSCDGTHIEIGHYEENEKERVFKSGLIAEECRVNINK